MITRLLDPLPVPGGGTPTATPVAPATTVVTSNAMTPQKPKDDFLEPTTEPVKEEVVAPVPKAGEIVVDGKIVPDPAAKVAPTVPVTYTPEQVAELMKRGSAPATPAAVPAKPLTPEEIDARLNTFKPTAQDVADIAEGGDKALAAYHKMGAAMVKNAVTVAGIIIQDEVRKLQAWAQPHVAYAQQQQANMAQAQYFTDNPTHVGLEPLVAQVAQQMTVEKFKGTPAETFKEVGARVNALVARLKIPVTQPAANGTAPAAGVVKPAATRMSTVSTGGQGGAGGAGGSGGNDPEADIWSKQ
jgi:hypothetical protein